MTAAPGLAWLRRFQPWRRAAQERIEPPPRVIWPPGAPVQSSGVPGRAIPGAFIPGNPGPPPAVPPAPLAAAPGVAWRNRFQPWRRAAQERQQPAPVIAVSGSAALAPMAAAGSVSSSSELPPAAALPGPSWRIAFQPWRRAAAIRVQPPGVITAAGSAALAPMGVAGTETASPELAPAAALPGPAWRRAFQPWRRAAQQRIQPPAVITVSGSAALAPMAVAAAVTMALELPPAAALPGPSWRRAFQPWRKAAGIRIQPPQPPVSATGSAALAVLAVSGTGTPPPPQLRAALLGGTVTGSTYSGTVTDSNTYGGSAS